MERRYSFKSDELYHKSPALGLDGAVSEEVTDEPPEDIFNNVFISASVIPVARVGVPLLSTIAGDEPEPPPDPPLLQYVPLET